MAGFDFSGVDTSHYQEWEQVKGPSGQTYYIVPGNEGYVYDPFLSKARGHRVFWVNPTASQQKQEQAQKNAEKLQNAQLKQLDPINQLIPTVGTVGGLYAANKLLNPAGVAAATPAAPTIAGGSPGIIDSVTTGAGDIVNSISNAFGGGNVFSRGAEVVPSLPTSLGTSAAQGVQSSIGGGTVMADGSIVGEGTTLQNNLGSFAKPLGVAGIGLGAYEAFQGFKEHDPIHAGLGGLGIAGGLNALGYSNPYVAAAVIGLPALASYLGGLGDKDMWKTEGKRMDELSKQGYKQIPVNKNRLTHGQSKEELIDQAIKAGVDPTFARTRDENFISPESLSLHATTIEHGGVKGNQQSRFKDAQDAVNAHKALGNVIREHHGTIDVDWEKVAQWKKDHDPKGPQKKNDATKVTGPINKAKPNNNAPVARTR